MVAELLEAAGCATAQAASAGEALELARRDTPRLAIIDVNLGSTSGYIVCDELRHSLNNKLPIIFISGDRTEPFDRVAGLLLGADDYVTKPFDPDELVARVRRMLERAATDEAATERNPYRLTAREQDVLGLLVDGLSQPDIAERLHLSPNTVGTHIQRIIRKMGVRSRTQAVALAAREGVIFEARS